ncbi:MAG: DNA replication and repair protein RecF, partial [Verrucomicrobiota bacterium]|nr:DNA replication and repair protein RecF [Verrucomicrobiota bacterium]
MLTTIQLRNFRCFTSLSVEFAPGTNLICGANAQGKTSVLEAVCALLRLQSPRSSTLTRAIRHEAKGFVLDGFFRSTHLQFYFGRERKKLALDSVEQKTSAAWLELARVVYFANQDIAIVRGPAEHRRAFLNFVAPQLDPQYRHDLRAFEKALRSRNHLLRAPLPKWREISAFDAPLADSGQRIIDARRSLVESLQLSASVAMGAISASAEELRVEYVCGAGGSLREALAASPDEDLRLRTTTQGPHRDDLAFFVNDQPIEFASE